MADEHSPRDADAATETALPVPADRARLCLAAFQELGALARALPALVPQDSETNGHLLARGVAGRMLRLVEVGVLALDDLSGTTTRELAEVVYLDGIRS